jgi:hypothetical protein
MKIKPDIAGTIACLVLCACANRLTKETAEAVSALKKIQAGTQVGINYQEYGRQRGFDISTQVVRCSFVEASYVRFGRANAHGDDYQPISNQ